LLDDSRFADEKWRRPDIHWDFEAIRGRGLVFGQDPPGACMNALRAMAFADKYCVMIQPDRPCRVCGRNDWVTRHDPATRFDVEMCSDPCWKLRERGQ
jgi:hypothetical protein